MRTQMIPKKLIPQEIQCNGTNFLGESENKKFSFKKRNKAFDLSSEEMI